jgi:hypothetical protein
MSTANAAIPAFEPDLQSQLQAAVDRLVKGTRDPEAIRNACDRMDRMREEMRRRAGDVEFAVDIIRDVRNAR